MNKSIFSEQHEITRRFLTRMRQGAGLTQRQLEERLEREHNLVGRIELGERRLDVVEFWHYAKACSLEPSTTAAELMLAIGKSELDTRMRDCSEKD